MIELSLQHVKKAFGTNVVLKDVTLTLKQGERMGLVGVNGCGKSTLLRVLTGQEASDGGVISMDKDAKIGYMAQQSDVKKGSTVLQELEDVYAPVLDIERQMRALEIEMASASGKALEALCERYARLNDAFERGDGYAWRSNIMGVLAGLGFTKAQHEQEAALLSGGELTRLSLAKLLLQKPDLLLLDEPTNHLDLEALSWLENYLSAYRGAILVVSHDRYFLDHVCTCISELLFGRIEQYQGNYSSYMAQRADRFESRRRAYDIQQQEIARQEAVIAKLRSFNREKSIKRARSREKMLDKIERVDKPQDEKEIRFRFEAKRRSGEDVLDIRGLKKTFGERTLFERLNLRVLSGERVALIGANGVGKSTLFNCLTGQLAQSGGVYQWGANVDIGYYDQHQRALHPDKTVLREVWDDFPRMLQHEVRGALGLFLFSGDDVFMPIHTLSGGERGRVALTKLMLRKDNVLLLDEPTNHLDMDSREVLEDALDDFEGTIIAISHDRYFINRFATRVVLLTPDGAQSFAGDYDDYLKAQSRPPSAYDEASALGKTRTELEKEKRAAKKQQETLAQMQNDIQALEKEITDLEQEYADTEASLALPEVYANPECAAATHKQLEQLKDDIARRLVAWEQRASAYEQATK